MLTTGLNTLAMFRFGFGRPGFGHNGGLFEFILFGGFVAVVAWALAQALLAWRSAPGTALAHRALVLAGLALGQAALGVATLLFVVPIGLALAHQALALTLFGMAMAHAGLSTLARGASFRRLPREAV